jgi:maltooligosyltrehalose trehalohydrolase
MLFMGEEWGASTPWLYFTDHTDPAVAEAVREGRRAEFGSHGWSPDGVPDPQDPATFERSKLDWSEIGSDPHSRLLDWYRRLLALRREHPDLSDPSLDHTDVRYDDGALRMRRGSHVVLVNLSQGDHGFDVDGTVLLSWTDEVRRAAGGLVLPGESAAVLTP